MSKAVMESVIGKAILDTEFRHALLANPDQALAGFDLSTAEKTSIKRVDNETLELVAKFLIPRLEQESLNVSIPN